MNIDNEKLVSWNPESMLEIYLGEPDDFLKGFIGEEEFFSIKVK